MCLQLFEPFLTRLLCQSRESLKKVDGVTININLSRKTFFYSLISTKLVFTLTYGFKAVLQTLYVDRRQIYDLLCSLKVTKLKLCISGGRGSNKEISLFLDCENC